MVAIIFIIACCLALWHLLMLIMNVMLGKFLIFSRFGMFRLITQPERSMKTVKSGLKSTVHHLAWLCVCSIVIAVIVM